MASLLADANLVSLVLEIYLMAPKNHLTKKAGLAIFPIPSASTTESNSSETIIESITNLFGRIEGVIATKQDFSLLENIKDPSPAMDILAAVAVTGISGKSLPISDLISLQASIAGATMAQLYKNHLIEAIGKDKNPMSIDKFLISYIKKQLGKMDDNSISKEGLVILSSLLGELMSASLTLQGYEINEKSGKAKPESTKGHDELVKNLMACKTAIAKAIKEKESQQPTKRGLRS